MVTLIQWILLIWHTLRVTPDSADLEDIHDLADLEVSYMELGDVDYIQGLVSKHFSFDDVACFDFAITTIAIAAVG